MRICAALEKKKVKMHRAGSFNAFAEELLDQISTDLYVPEGTQKLDRIIELQEQILELLKRQGGERVTVKGHRPKDDHERQIRKAV